MSRPRLAAAALAVVALSACAAPEPSTTATLPETTPTSTTPPTPTGTPSDGGGIELPTAGRPFDAEILLAAMRDSRRPGGVPDELETGVIAASLADAIWTIDGAPWETLTVGGSCGSEVCTLEVAGAREGDMGEDLWVFDVTPQESAVELTTAALMGLPMSLAPQLDELARGILRDATLEGLSLAGVRWLPPPDEGRFVLAYRGDGEEGSCGADVTLDVAGGEVVEETPVGC